MGFWSGGLEEACTFGTLGVAVCFGTRLLLPFGLGTVGAMGAVGGSGSCCWCCCRSSGGGGWQGCCGGLRSLSSSYCMLLVSTKWSSLLRSRDSRCQCPRSCKLRFIFSSAAVTERATSAIPPVMAWFIAAMLWLSSCNLSSNFDEHECIHPNEELSGMLAS